MKKTAEIVLIALFSLIIVFHFMIIFSIIPYTIVWGGRLISSGQMIIFESISILLNGFFLAIILIKIGYLKVNIPSKVIRSILWGMLILFLLNTLGNLASESGFEKLVFTPLTLVISLCLIISLFSKPNETRLAHDDALKS
ncbi:MAG: hypothetical protein HWE15_05685 [Algoriphagus sp.]|uniref:hypothetical protein n=1 Tax=Algoriphagus sp. TaxID=1872435 RepID=UPI0017E8326E|nr:hypothetical protein [Algoriphagus sp.]NVJ85777.1 hypothetical protein [Algoriphagus sp.]